MWGLKIYSILINILDIYSIVPSRNVPLGIRLLAQGCLYNIIVKEGAVETTITIIWKPFSETCHSHPLSMRNQKELCKDLIEQINQLQQVLCTSKLYALLLLLYFEGEK